MEAGTLKRAYEALHIPHDHVRVMTLDPKRVVGNNPYHVSTVGPATPVDADGKPVYAADWAFMLGEGSRTGLNPEN